MGAMAKGDILPVAATRGDRGRYAVEFQKCSRNQQRDKKSRTVVRSDVSRRLVYTRRDLSSQLARRGLVNVYRERKREMSMLGTKSAAAAVATAELSD